MDGNRFTQSSIQAINRCERLAAEYGNSAITPLHIACSLTDKDCIIPRILTRSGIDGDGFAQAAREEVERLPKVSGSGRGEVYISSEANAVFAAAEKIASQMKDEYISVEHIFLALIDCDESKVRSLFSRFGITRNVFLQGLKQVRGNTQVTNDNPEETYEALEKYGSDLTAAARRHKL